MQYILLIYDNENAFDAAPKDKAEKVMGEFFAYTQAIKKAGVLVSSNRLQRTSAASTVTIAGGKTQVLDGPFAETKEHLGGYYLIDVPNLDEAIAWAARCPGAAIGKIEVRPIWVM